MGLPLGGRATDRTRGLHRLSSPDELRMPRGGTHAVRGRVLRSVPERRRIRTAVQGPEVSAESV